MSGPYHDRRPVSFVRIVEFNCDGVDGQDSVTCLNASGTIGGDDGETTIRLGTATSPTRQPWARSLRGRASCHGDGRPEYSRQARFRAVPRETETGLCLREKAGAKFLGDEALMPSYLLWVATERRRDGFCPTQCSLDEKWSLLRM